jgi:ankyrin repeat protein
MKIFITLIFSSLLFFSCKKSSDEILAERAEADRKGQLLIQAASNRDFELLKLLVAEGADFNAKDKDNNGDTALMSASFKGHLEVVKLLIEEGADINAKALSLVKTEEMKALLIKPFLSGCLAMLNQAFVS